MIDLAAAAVLAEVPLDLNRLFRTEDPDEFLFMAEVTNRVIEIKRQQAEEAKRSGS